MEITDPLRDPIKITYSLADPQWEIASPFGNHGTAMEVVTVQFVHSKLPPLQVSGEIVICAVSRAMTLIAGQGLSTHEVTVRAVTRVGNGQNSRGFSRGWICLCTAETCDVCHGANSTQHFFVTFSSVKY